MDNMYQKNSYREPNTTMPRGWLKKEGWEAWWRTPVKTFKGSISVVIVDVMLTIEILAKIP